MYKQYPAAYDQDQISLPCCPFQYKNETFIKSKAPESTQKAKSTIKKISLKKMNANSGKQPTKQSTYYQNNCRTPRTLSNYPELQLQQPYQQQSHRQKPTDYPLSSIISEAKSNPLNSLVYHMRNKSALTPTTKFTTYSKKIQRIMPTYSEQLQKSKKSTSSETLLFLQKMKQSVASFTQSDSCSARLQESQILLDYFHPSQGQLNRIKDILQQKNGSHSSFPLQK